VTALIRRVACQSKRAQAVHVATIGFTSEHRMARPPVPAGMVVTPGTQEVECREAMLIDHDHLLEIA
jgi:hypothetical protein